MLHQGQLGIHPPGALGVAFFVHADAECFIGRGGDGITQPLKDAGALRLLDDGKLRTVPLKGRIFANLLEADALDRMPEVLMVCCNPDQLGVFTADLTRYLENLAERSKLRAVADIRRHVPILLVPPNGILAEQMLRTYDEQLHESLLLGRLPGLTEDMIQALLDRVIRGVSFQAGGRRGFGPDAVYLLERKGFVLFAGGGESERERIEAVLSGHDYPFKHAKGVSGTRIEFDKAMVSIVLNVGGLIHTVKPDGDLIDLRMGDLCNDPAKSEFVETITRAVFDVGRATGAYPADAAYDQVWAEHRATILAHAGHVTSSLKMFRDALASGLKGVKLFSNEEWILTPLRLYAANAGMKEQEVLFKSLARRVQASMARAIRHRDDESDGIASRNGNMKLTAQRNISIELFESGPDNLRLVGTMLDNEHLIKLEMNIYIPDEQITRSRLDMVRVPFPVCREVENIAERLVGLRIERGVLNEINNRVGGRVGCSHIKELASNLVYFVASYLVPRRAGVDPMAADYVVKPPAERFSLTKELLKDSCLAYCQTTALDLDERIGIKRIGEEHTNPLPLGDHDPTLGALLRGRARRWPDRIFIRHRRGDVETALTWTEFADQTFAIARRLIDLDVRAGDRLCMVSENRVEMFMFELATMSIGAVTVPVFAGYPRPQIAYVIGHARPRFVVVSGNHQLAKIEADRHPWVEKYFCMDFDDDSRRWGALDFATLTVDAGVSDDRLERRIESVQPDDLCMVMYTSGTTGPPKGVRLCHRNIISQQKAVELVWDLSEKDVLMQFLPWHHSFGGLFERFMALYHGVELCLDDSRGRDLDRLIDNWRAFNPTLFFSVPRVHDLLLTRCREDKAIEKLVFGGRLRFVLTAGASLPATVAAVYRDHDIPVLEGWGLTETSPCVTLTTIDYGWRSGFVGFPIPGVAVRIDANQEILVKGPNVMQGYFDDEEATGYVMTEDGWFRTGDLGEFTKDGLRVFGRKDGAFKLTTGEKVHPLRIENVLVNESPYVSLVMALGSGKDYVAALIYPDLSRVREWAEQRGIPTDRLIERPEIRELFSAEVERLNPMIEVKYQRVRRIALAEREPSLERGELTPSGKLVRKSVAQSYKRKIEALFARGPSPDIIEIEQPELQRT